jgi:putative acetyltransferase
MSTLDIRVDDLRGPEIRALLEQHLRSLAEVTPLQSRHALDLDGLRQPDVTFWSLWRGGKLAGCAALKELNPRHGEIKSMRTAAKHVRQGIASAAVAHIISEAKRRGYQRLSLETGATAFFAPAHRLYEKFGFSPCAPFNGYSEDPNSLFMTREL